jgi:hypothetical protein
MGYKRRGERVKIRKVPPKENIYFNQDQYFKSEYFNPTYLC